MRGGQGSEAAEKKQGLYKGTAPRYQRAQLRPTEEGKKQRQGRRKTRRKRTQAGGRVFQAPCGGDLRTNESCPRLKVLRKIERDTKPGNGRKAEALWEIESKEPGENTSIMQKSLEACQKNTSSGGHSTNNDGKKELQSKKNQRTFEGKKNLSRGGGAPTFK